MPEKIILDKNIEREIEDGQIVLKLNESVGA